MCIYALSAGNSPPGQQKKKKKERKHVWLLLQHVCKCTTCSILTRLICKLTIYFFLFGCRIQLSGIFSLSLLTWLTHYHLSFLLAQMQMCLHTRKCVRVRLCLMQHAPLYKTPTLFLSLPSSFCPHCMLTYSFGGVKALFICLFLHYMFVFSSRGFILLPFSHICPVASQYCG